MSRPATGPSNDAREAPATYLTAGVAGAFSYLGVGRAVTVSSRIPHTVTPTAKVETTSQ